MGTCHCVPEAAQLFLSCSVKCCPQQEREHGFRNMLVQGYGLPVCSCSPPITWALSVFSLYRASGTLVLLCCILFLFFNRYVYSFTEINSLNLQNVWPSSSSIHFHQLLKMLNTLVRAAWVWSGTNQVIFEPLKLGPIYKYFQVVYMWLSFEKTYLTCLTVTL